MRACNFVEFVDPAVSHAVGIVGTVVATQVSAAFGDLDSAAWFEVSVGLLNQSRPIVDRSAHGPDVNEVEVVLREGP